jgi:AcrR family transcriptional regulator
MGIAERKSREQKARRESVLSAARKLFLQKGFANTSMEELASGAELAKGTLYLYFKSKDEIIYTLLSPILMDFLERLRVIASDPREPADSTLRRIVKCVGDTYVEEPEMFRLVLHYNAREYELLLSEQNFSHLRDSMRGILHATEEVIRRGLDAGVFHKADPKTISTLLWNICIGAIQFDENRTFNGSRSYLMQTLDAGADLLIRGLKNSELGE